jgi:hypothetical protein
MTQVKSLQISDRARRFALHLPVYYRVSDSPTWLKGTTENISHTGVLFLSSSPMAPETTLDLRLKVAVRSKTGGPAEVRCKGLVVRLEPRSAPQTPIALAVAISDYRIVRQQAANGDPGRAA